MSKDESVSCHEHSGGAVDGCAACRVIANDVLSCPVHVVNAEGECAECEAIAAIWGDYFMNCSRQAAQDGGHPVVAAWPVHGVMD